ncbi:MAG: barstar family protein [Anaerotignum sp.]
MKILLDGKRMTSKTEAHEYLKEAFAFPAYYGGNLDALHDCLTELGEMEVEFQHTEEMKAALGKYAEKLLRVFHEAENIVFFEI